MTATSRQSDPEGRGRGEGQLPLRELILALFLIVPCLTPIFAQVFFLTVIPLGPKNNNNVTKVLVGKEGMESIAEGNVTTGPLPPPTVPGPSPTSKLTVERRILKFMNRTVYDDFDCKDPKQKTVEIKTVHALFIGFGSVLAGLLSDLNSRLLTCKVFLCATVVMGLTTLVAKSISMFEVIWALYGFFSYGSYIAIYVRIVERLPPKWLLPIALFCSGLMWTLSTALGIFLPFVFGDWTVVMYMLTLWLFGALMAYLFIPAKPLCKFCPEPEFEEEEPEETEDRLSQLFTHRRYLIRLVILSLNWAAFAFILYGFILGKEPLYKSNAYVSMSLSMVLYFVAQTLAAMAAVKTNALMAPFSTFSTCIGVCFVIFAFFYEDKQLVFMITQVISFITSGAWTCLYLITAASFPKKFRCTAFGICSFVARLGMMLGINYSDQVLPNMTIKLILAFFVIVVGLSVVLFFPEGDPSTLIDTIADEDEEYRQRKAAGRNETRESQNTFSVNLGSQQIVMDGVKDNDAEGVKVDSVKKATDDEDVKDSGIPSSDNNSVTEVEITEKDDPQVHVVLQDFKVNGVTQDEASSDDDDGVIVNNQLKNRVKHRPIDTVSLSSVPATSDGEPF